MLVNENESNALGHGFNVSEVNGSANGNDSSNLTLYNERACTSFDSLARDGEKARNGEKGTSAKNYN